MQILKTDKYNNTPKIAYIFIPQLPDILCNTSLTSNFLTA